MIHARAGAKGEHQNCIVKRRWQALVDQTWTWNFSKALSMTWNFPKALPNRNLLSAMHHHSARFLCSL
jgi:hypothetical protein